MTSATPRTASYTGFVNGETSASLTTQPTLASSHSGVQNAGTYTGNYTASGAVDTNYTISYVAGDLTVNPAALTITANGQTITYGTTVPTTTASYAGFVNGETSASLTTQPTLASSKSGVQNAGTYTGNYTASGAVDTNYTISYVAGDLTVNPAALTITANGQTITYGTTVPTTTASYTGFVNGETSANLTTQPTLASSHSGVQNAGTYTGNYTASGAVDTNYTISYVAGDLTVNPAALTITANGQTITYGTTVPTTTASYTGFVNGETSASLTTQPTLASSKSGVQNAGTYTGNYTASGAADTNYTISYVAGDLTVNPAALTITANGQTITYGATVPTTTASYTGFVNGDTSASLTTAPTLASSKSGVQNAGTYTGNYTASGAVDSNYTISYAAGDLTVNPAALTITANGQTITYGTTVPTTTASYTGFVNGDTSASLTTAPTLASSKSGVQNAGTYTGNYTASGAVDSNYTISYAAGDLTVNPAALTITANGQTITYGATVPTTTASYTGFVNGDTSASLTTQPTLASSKSGVQNAGTYTGDYTASGAVDSNYTISYAAGNLVVNPAALTITAQGQTITYGTTVPTTTASYTGFVNGETSASLTTQPTLASSHSGVQNAGTYTGNYTASGAVDTNYTISYVAGTLVVNPAALTITANGQTITYGATVPTTTASYTGFVNGETSANLTTQPTLASSHSGVQNAGTYTGNYTASGAVDTNYTISYVAGDLTVNPAALTITANGQTITYGATVPTTTASYTGFVNGETSASLTTQPTLASSKSGVQNAGTYTGNYTASGAVDTNYTISYVAGDLTVNPAALTITANGQTITYGTTVPTTTASYTGFVNGETSASLTTQPTLASSKSGVQNAGTYTGNYTASGAVDTNYTISYVAGDLTVNPAALTITANGQTNTYGTTVPTTTASYTGFVNGETSASLTTQPTLASSKSGVQNAGTYTGNYTASGAVDTNYTISYVAGDLTVNPAALTITANGQTITYGTTVPTTTASYTGFVNGETSASLTTQPTLASSKSGVQNAGTYTGNYTASGAVDTNYTISYVAGDLTVNPAALTITANGQTITYGTTVPTTTASYTGFVNGETSASLTTQPTLASSKSGVQNAGTYTGNYTASGAVDTNYTISYVAGDLTVNPAALTITANGQTITYGTTVPTTTASYTGFVNGETSANLTTQPTLASSHSGVQNAGTYTGNYTASGAVDTNYTISYVAGDLTVNPAALTITANGQTITYGATVPTTTASYTGFVNGETSASLTTQPTLASSKSGVQNAGTYTGNYTASGAVDTNYTISYVAGDLTVNPAALTITANGQTITYGTTVPTTTASYTGFVNGETSASLTTQPTLASSKSGVQNAGTYTGNYTASGAVDTNYTISYVAGDLTVNPAALTITASGQTITYGTTVPTTTASYTGFVNGETSASLTTQPTLASSKSGVQNAGTYTGNYTASGAVDTNYTISYVAGDLIVNPAALSLMSITANDESKTFGNTFVFAGTEFASTGLVNGDTVGSVTFTSSGAINTAPVGSYAIIPSAATGGTFNASNYTITYVNGVMVVNPALLTITANGQTITYGTTVPATTASYTGFVNGETSASLTTQPTLASSHSGVQNAGTYTGNYTASGAVDTNYTISYVAGDLTVNPAALTITANGQTITYGTTVPATTASYTGFVNGETSASLTTQPTLASSHSGVQNAGTYTGNYTASGAVDTNYTISYVAGDLTVNPAALTITANGQTITYGTTVPATTASYTGFVNGETSANLTTQPTLASSKSGVQNAGTYTGNYTASGAVDTNYTISYVAGNLTVNPSALTITANGQTITYGTTVPTTTASYTGFVNGETSANLTTQPTLASSHSGVQNAGTYTGNYTASGAVDTNYTISYVAGNLTVNPSALTITANGQTITYGTTVPTTTASYTGFVNGETSANLTTQPTLASSHSGVQNAGTYTGNYTASGAVDTNYTISYVAGNLTVNPSALTITANGQTITYGTTVPTTTASYTGFVNGETSASLTTQPTLASSHSGVQNAGTYSGNYTASGAVDTNYTISYVAGDLTVNPAALTITAQGQTITYGTTVPTTTASYTGFVNGETSASLTTQPTLASSHSGVQNAGTYTGNYTASGAVDTNYTISYVAGNLVVSAAALTITASGQTITYGTTVPTTTASYTGFVNGDTSASLTTAPTVASSHSGKPNAGTYTGNYTASGAVDANYTISYVAGNLVVSPAALTITANGQTITYGTTAPTTTASYAGFVNGDTSANLTTQPIFASSHSGKPNAGTYTGNYTASGAVDGNYTISYVAGNLVVNPAALTITANGQTITYGSSVPTTIASYTGFVNGDTSASLTTQPILASSQSGVQNAGTYTGNYTASGAVDNNYTISYVAGDLTINPAALTITANGQTITYGATVPTTTAAYSGFVNGDTSASLTTQPALASSQSGVANAGTYIGNYTASGAVDPNYTIGYVAGNLIINPASLVLMSITANDQNKTFGNTFIFTGTEFASAGLLTGDTVGSVTFTSSGAISTAPVGSYAIVPSAATGGTFNASNYTITYVNGTMVVNAAPVITPLTTSIPNTVLLVSQNIPTYTPPTFSTAPLTTYDNAAPAGSTSAGQGSTGTSASSTAGVLQGTAQNFAATNTMNGGPSSINMMGGILQIDQDAIKKFHLEYLEGKPVIAR